MSEFDITEIQERCKGCLGTGKTPCNGTDTGWCDCVFCGGSGVYTRRLKPTPEDIERHDQYMNAQIERLRIVQQALEADQANSQVRFDIRSLPTAEETRAALARLIAGMED